MGVLDKLFNKAANDIIDTTGDAIDKIFTNDDEKLKAKEQLTEIVLSELNKLYAVQGEVLKTEMQGNKLQRNWRPITILTFTLILVCKWFGWTDSSIPDELELKLMEIIEFGLAGYVAGRSLEKIATTVTQNTDLSFLKKRDRKNKIR